MRSPFLCSPQLSDQWHWALGSRPSPPRPQKAAVVWVLHPPARRPPAGRPLVASCLQPPEFRSFLFRPESLGVFITRGFHQTALAWLDGAEYLDVKLLLAAWILMWRAVQLVFVCFFLCFAVVVVVVVDFIFVFCGCVCFIGFIYFTIIFCIVKDRGDFLFALVVNKIEMFCSLFWWGRIVLSSMLCLCVDEVKLCYHLSFWLSVVFFMRWRCIF